MRAILLATLLLALTLPLATVAAAGPCDGGHPVEEIACYVLDLVTRVKIAHVALP